MAVQSDGGGADVVLDHARDTERRLEPPPERQVLPAEVDGERHVAGRGVDAARDAEADRGDVGHRGPGLADRLPDDGGDLGDRLIRLRGSGRNGLPGEDRVALADDEDGDLAAADVDANPKPARGRGWGTAIAPAACSCSAVTGLPPKV